MLAKVLIDNVARGAFIGEWGLAIWIEYEGHKILLDGGTSGRFVENARLMGVDLGSAELGVLSHAHFDHANGLEAFFAVNPNAKIHLRADARETCYGMKEGVYHYNGIRKGMLREYGERFVYHRGVNELLPGVWLVPHRSAGLEKIAARSGLYVRRGLRMRPDNFAHEQSLVFKDEKGLVIFNSCSHAGPDNIISEVRAAFPEQKIYALIGGLHLYKLSDDEVCCLAERIRECGIEWLYTGHCTGDRGYELLREALGEGVQQLYTGMEIEV